MPNETRLIERFMNYVRCGSESRNERNFALMVEAELDRMGIPFTRQDLSDHVCSNAWNILAKVPGVETEKPILFAVHLDTVAPGDGVHPVLSDGEICSDGSTVLGADGKAGIAIVLEAIECLQESGTPHRPVEILFPICQEIDLSGAKYADYSEIRSEEAIMLDHTHFGEIVCESPEKIIETYEIFGQTAHAAMEPEAGVHALQTAAVAIGAIPLGQVDADSIINVADFVSLSPTNIIPDQARFDVEIRSFRPEVVAQYARKIEETVQRACKASGARYVKTVQVRSRMLRTGEDLPLVTGMLESMRTAGISGRIVRTFGLCDRLPFYDHGITGINVGVGMRNIHSARETISCANMICMMEILCNFLKCGVREAPPEAV